jgi:hypothetical protein
MDRTESLEEVFPRSFSCLSEEEGRRLRAEFLRKFALGMPGLFPFFLKSKKWPGSSGFLPDLAALEWALRLAERSPPVEPRGFERVTVASESEWFSARFRFDPAHAVMVSDWPINEIFHEPRSRCERRPGKYLVYRPEGKGSVKLLDENESRLLEALSLGLPLGEILDRPGGPEFDAFLFHDWIQSGLLAVIQWAIPTQ